MPNDQVREISKALFGSRYRLEVAAALADIEPSVLHVRGLAEQLALADNLVRLELLHFEGAHLLVRLPRPPGQQQQHFERMSSAYWQLARELLEEVRSVAILPR